jgi:hypothetical protein
VITLLAFFYTLFATIVPVINTETAWLAPWSRDNGRSEFDGSKKMRSLVKPAPSSRHIDVRELDALGRPKVPVWSLPMVVVEAMTTELINLKNNAK